MATKPEHYVPINHSRREHQRFQWQGEGPFQ